MRWNVFAAALCAGAVGVAALTAGERPPQSGADDPATADRPGDKTQERPLGTLQVRCRKMLAMQTAVRDGTRALHKVIEGHADRKPRPEDRQAALKLADNVKALIAEATGAIAMLEKEGAAVAFPEVFRELRNDMRRVRLRLEAGDVGADTQAVEQDIIDTLTEMIGALKKR